MKLRNLYRALLEGLEAYYQIPYRNALLREKRDSDYLFKLFIYMELLGIENPVAAYTIELQGLLLQDFHDWHSQAGMEHSPFSHISCC